MLLFETANTLYEFERMKYLKENWNGVKDIELLIA